MFPLPDATQDETPSKTSTEYIPAGNPVTSNENCPPPRLAVGVELEYIALVVVFVNCNVLGAVPP